MKFIVAVKIWVESETAYEAETVVNSALDNLVSNGSEIVDHAVDEILTESE